MLLRRTFLKILAAFPIFGSFAPKNTEIEFDPHFSVYIEGDNYGSNVTASASYMNFEAVLLWLMKCNPEETHLFVSRNPFRIGKMYEWQKTGDKWMYRHLNFLHNGDASQWMSGDFLFDREFRKSDKCLLSSR